MLILVWKCRVSLYLLLPKNKKLNLHSFKYIICFEKLKWSLYLKKLFFEAFLFFNLKTIFSIASSNASWVSWFWRSRSNALSSALGRLVGKTILTLAPSLNLTGWLSSSRNVHCTLEVPCPDWRTNPIESISFKIIMLGACSLTIYNRSRTMRLPGQ